MTATCTECGRKMPAAGDDQRVMRAYRIPRKLDKRLRKRAQETGYTMQDIVVAGLEYLTKKPKYLRQILKKFV